MKKAEDEVEYNKLEATLRELQLNTSLLFKKSYWELQKVNSEKSKRIIDEARRLIPKAFFAQVMTHTKLGKEFILVKQFASEIRDGRVAKAISLPEYIQGLYHSGEQSPARIN
jgi:hypothetical protein